MCPFLYPLGDAGKERLADLLEDYREITIGIGRLLTYDFDFAEEDDEPRG